MSGGEADQADVRTSLSIVNFQLFPSTATEISLSQF